MSKLLGDNVFIFTLGVVLVQLLAVLLIGLHVLFADGPHVDQEINFLEVVGGGGTLAQIMGGIVHAWLAKIKPQQTGTSGAPTNGQPG